MKYDVHCTILSHYSMLAQFNNYAHNKPVFWAYRYVLLNNDGFPQQSFVCIQKYVGLDFISVCTSYHLIYIIIYTYLPKVRESEQLNDEMKNIHNNSYCLLFNNLKVLYVGTYDAIQYSTQFYIIISFLDHAFVYLQYVESLTYT